MNQIQTFNFNGASIRTVTLPSGEPGFVGKDVAERLGYVDPTTAIRNHCKGVPIQHPLSTPGGLQNVRILTEPDVLRLIVSSKLPEAEAFEKWVFEEVLPSIRKTGGYSPQKPFHLEHSYADALAGTEIVCRMLNLEGAAKLGMLRTATEITAPHLLPMLPVYAVDAPRDTAGALIDTSGSSEPTSSLTDLLKKHDVGLSAVKFNQKRQAAGLQENLTRPSTSTPGMVRNYWSITAKGRAFGKNVTHPKNQSETQPRWFNRTFLQLIESL